MVVLLNRNMSIRLACGELELHGTAGVWVVKTCTSNRRKAPRGRIERNPVGSTLLALDAGLNLERNYVGSRDWAFRV
jgi:hypothetical protein